MTLIPYIPMFIIKTKSMPNTIVKRVPILRFFKVIILLLCYFIIFRNI